MMLASHLLGASPSSYNDALHSFYVCAQWRQSLLAVLTAECEPSVAKTPAYAYYPCVCYSAGKQHGCIRPCPVSHNIHPYIYRSYNE